MACKFSPGDSVKLRGQNIKMTVISVTSEEPPRDVIVSGRVITTGVTGCMSTCEGGERPYTEGELEFWED